MNLKFGAAARERSGRVGQCRRRAERVREVVIVFTRIELGFDDFARADRVVGEVRVKAFNGKLLKLSNNPKLYVES